MRRPLALIPFALLLAGCGLGPGDRATGVSVAVSRDFGTVKLGERREKETEGEDTIMRVLQRDFRVRTRYGGQFVQAIDGVSGGGSTTAWTYYVNGSLAEEGAASRKVTDGDQIVWDLHDSTAAQSIPAIVGSFPEPFRTGEEGRRYPTRIDCAESAQPQCDAVEKRLQATGIKQTSKAGLRQSVGTHTVRIVVGLWRDVRTDPVAARIGDGPKVSGVYARFDEAARTLSVLDPRGRVARRLGAGAGLIAATAYEEQQPTWVVTGTDEAGLRRAVGALEEGVLGGHFALAIAPDDRAVPAPLVRR